VITPESQLSHSKPSHFPVFVRLSLETVLFTALIWSFPLWAQALFTILTLMAAEVLYQAYLKNKINSILTSQSVEDINVNVKNYLEKT
jgi:hypothetical protein